LGLQPGRRVGTSALFVVPSTSGLCNGRAAARLAAFRELAAWLDSRGRLGPATDAAASRAAGA
ncbi:MAG: hypothetical protein M3Q10_20645, partial [Chloroflexota bacterium]|nr:hypothetical protein [Chloroflexota bacterium]